MGVLTEEALRRALRAGGRDAVREYRVPPGTVVTPSAKAYLAERKIALVREPPAGGLPPGTAADRHIPAARGARDAGKAPAGDNGNLPAFAPPSRYQGVDGGYHDKKPEHMTALRGNRLVGKDHPVIRLRGRLDSLLAEVAAVQVALERLGRGELAERLDEVQAFLHELLRCEVLDAPLKEQMLLGMREAEIRERSHFPGKYYGIKHFGASRRDGEAVVQLNRLRTISREVELVAYDAFRQEWGPPQREDLLRGLNRLSSLFYVLMLEEKSREGGTGIG